MTYRLGRRFALIEARFREIDRRFEAIDKRFENIDKRFSELKEYVDTRFNELKVYVDSRFNELREYVDSRFDDLKGYVDSRVLRIAEAFRSYQEFFIEYLSYQGVIRAPLEAEMLKNEASRMMKLATMNPLTKEEWEKIKYYLEKDQLTLEEALEFRELARKVTDEYGVRASLRLIFIPTALPLASWASGLLSLEPLSLASTHSG
ncbi:MAG: hypothetical protein QXI22_07070 [Sulfolobales archaeon]